MNNRKMVRGSWSSRVSGWLIGFLDVEIVRSRLAILRDAFFNSKELGVLFISLSLIATPVGAAVFKWVDKDGVTHYSATPPAEGDVNTVHIAPAPPSAALNSSTAKPQQDPSKSEDEDADIKQSQEQAKNETTTKKKCQDARDNLALLQHGRRVFTMDEHGQRTYLDDKERAAKIQGMKNIIEENCD